ncbi:MAG: hypothetical protein ACPGVB_02915 [Chitinophagales bacterium]
MKTTYHFISVLFLCATIFFAACNSEQNTVNEKPSITEELDSTDLEIVGEMDEKEEEIDLSDPISMDDLEVEEEDTIPVRSYSRMEDNEMLNPTPKSIEDYQPDSRGVYDITWLTLTDVKFEEKIAPEDSALYLYPTFGKIVKSLDGKKVSIKGFVIPIDATEHYYVLSANPFSACFFCGKAGPESIMELELKSDPSRAYQMDQFSTFEGTFRLNSTDVDHCNYMLMGAVLVEE